MEGNYYPLSERKETISCKHLKLEDLKKRPEAKNNKYLYRYIPEYPKPEFHTSFLKHETLGPALCGIKQDGGFRNPYGGAFIWWSLAVGPEEVKDAETRLLEKTFPDRMEVEGAEQQSFLWRFATSPAFLETSRLGSYRFTFPLQEVLTAYREQVCSGAEPVMRVYQTVLYPQQVMYSVLVHSPKFNQKFSDYPLLNDDPNSVCVYRDGRFIWRSEAMCETHWYELIIRKDPDQMEVRPLWNYQFYVWDHVAVALHMENDQVLKFDDYKLRQNLKFCEVGGGRYRGEFQNLDDAKELVMDLWPQVHHHLEVERSLQLSYPVTEIKLVLTGSSGVETSTTGNVLVGREIFFPSGFTPVHNVEVNHLQVKIFPTPGLAELSSYERRKKTLDTIRLSGPELQAFLLVMRLDNIDGAKIRETTERFESIFGNDALRRTMILFTHQNQEEPDISEMLEEVNNFLAEKLNNRYQTFNNDPNHRDPRKVSDLVNQVKMMIVGSE